MKKVCLPLLAVGALVVGGPAVAGAASATTSASASASASVNTPSVTNTLCIGTNCTAIGFDATSLDVEATADASASASSGAPVLTPVYGTTACGAGGSGAGVRITRPAVGGPVSVHLAISGASSSALVDVDLSTMAPGGSRIVAICTR